MLLYVIQSNPQIPSKAKLEFLFWNWALNGLLTHVEAVRLPAHLSVTFKCLLIGFMSLPVEPKSTLFLFTKLSSHSKPGL